MSAADRHAAAWHGTVGGYVNHVCRCAPCRTAQRAYGRAYIQRPEVKAKRRAYRQRPEVKAKRRAYRQRPEVKAKRRAAYREARRLIALARQVEAAP